MSKGITTIHKITKFMDDFSKMAIMTESIKTLEEKLMMVDDELTEQVEDLEAMNT